MAQPLDFVRVRHRRTLWQRSVWTLTIGLAVALVVSLTTPTPRYWLCTTAIAVLVAVLVRLRSRHVSLETARTIDSELHSHNRLEASAELAGRNDPLARAQQADTAAFLADHPPAAAWRWPVGLALCALLLLAHLSTAGWKTFQFTQARMAAGDVAVESSAPAEPAIPAAAIRWISPRAETTATPIEEVPLSAEADSGTGLEAIQLILTLNGEPRPPIALDPAAVAAGAHPLALSLYLDELRAQPFDMVTYHLRAQRTVPAGVKPSKPWPAVNSPLQMLQVRPLREDTQFSETSGSPADNPLNFVKRLKAAQIRLLRETFALANDTPPAADPARPAIEQAIASTQSVLAGKTHEAVELVVSRSAPAEVVNLITQAEERMIAAATTLARPDAAAATPDQGRAIAHLTAVEKHFTRVINRGQGGGGRQPPPTPDPFRTDEKLKLPPREDTPAGQVDQLARAQAQFAELIAGPQSPDDAATRQEKLAKEINALAASGALSSEAAEALRSAAAAAAEAVEQLREGDRAAALEPAMRAAAALKSAASQVDAGGRAEAAQALAEAQRSLNESSGDVAGATPENSAEQATAAAARTAATAAALREAAVRQQQTGSAESAAQLAALAQAIADSKVQADLKKIADADEKATEAQRDQAAAKLSALAQGAAAGQGKLGNREELLAQSAEALRRARANLERAARAGDGALGELAGEVIAQAQTAAAAQGNPQMGERIRTVVSALAPPPPGTAGAQRQAYVALLGEQIDALLAIIGSVEIAHARPQILTTGQPGEAPPAYRPAVADYFESLARETTPVTAAATVPKKP